MPFAPVNNIELYYEVHGPKPRDASTVVFAHGAGGNHLSWWQQVPHFMDRYTCVVFDHRGYGRSTDARDGPGGAMFVDDLRALLDHLGIERATLVAQSMGGWTCLGFALAHAERVERLVMCDTHGGLVSDQIAPIWRAALRAPEGQPREGAHPAAGVRMRREQPGLYFLYEEIGALNEERTGAEIMTLLRAAGAPTLAEVSALTMPALFIAGDEDVLIPPAVLDLAAAAIPGARVERVAEAGHSVYFERAQQFNAILETFLLG
ncbi:MAG: alpha/beta hydrolase [Chloroflexota bacterium]|nr:alpha/beta hydrolase [Chloroflexota bacterium]